MKKFEIKDVLRELQKKGIKISRRTFQFWQSLGLLPKPIKEVGKDGKGVYNFYPPIVIDLIKKICELKEKNLTLKEIRNGITISVLENVKHHLKELGYSEPFPYNEMLGYKAPDTGKDFKDFLKREGLHDISLINDLRFSNAVLKELAWWDSEAKFRVFALQHLSESARHLIFSSTAEIVNYKGYEVEHDYHLTNYQQNTVDDLRNRALKRLSKVIALHYKFNGMLAEMCGEYLGLTKSQWGEMGIRHIESLKFEVHQNT